MMMADERERDEAAFYYSWIFFQVRSELHAPNNDVYARRSTVDYSFYRINIGVPHEKWRASENADGNEVDSFESIVSTKISKAWEKY
jgi:hypothetical protein